MENATSIYNLRDDPSQRKMPVPVMSYSDVLKNMQEEPVQQEAPVQTQQAPVQHHQAPLQQHQAPEVLQFHPQPPVLSQPVIEPLSEKNEKDDFQSKSFQNDMLVLLSVYIIVHMTSVQKWIQTKVPNLINMDTGTMSVLGLLMNGVLVIVMWNISKKMVAKYLKEL
jgi:hypothetical protein